MQFHNLKWFSLYLKKIFTIIAAEIHEKDLLLLTLTESGGDVTITLEFMSPAWIELTLYFHHHKSLKAVPRSEKLRYLFMRKRLTDLFETQKPPFMD